MEVINAIARNAIDLRRADIMPTKTGPRRARNNGHGSRDRNRPSCSDRIR